MISQNRICRSAGDKLLYQRSLQYLTVSGYSSFDPDTQTAGALYP